MALDIRLGDHAPYTDPQEKHITRASGQASKDSAYDRNYVTKEIWRQEFPDIEKVQLPDESELFEFFGYA